MATLLSLFRKSLPDVDGALLRLLAGDRIDAAHAQGRTLEQHLRGTQRVLEAWGQSAVLQRAGLCHSLYSTDAFEHSSVPLTDRARVQQAIGKQAEALVFLFCAVQRAPLFRSIVRATSLEASEAIAIEVRANFEAAGTTISGAEAKDLLLLHLANAAEQAGTRSGRPAPWLEQFQRLVQLLAEKAPGAVPPVLLDLRGLGRSAERQGLMAYLRAIRSCNDAELAVPAMEEAARLLPMTGDPHVWLAWMWMGKGDITKRRHHAQLAETKLTAFGVAWDKRLLFDDWMFLARAGAKSKASSEDFELLHSLIQAESTIPDTGAAEQGGALAENERSRFETYLLHVAAAKSRRVSGFYPELRENPFWPAEQFALAGELTQRFEAIRAEIDSLQPHAFHDEAEDIARTGSWQVFMLLEAGRWNEDNLRRLPTLTRILRQASELRLAGGLIYLSRLAPGTVVAPHTGPTNMRLRLHFAIHVPEGDCAMRVGGEQRQWVEGKCTVFNDFLLHEVWNRTDGERLILLVDLWHPDLSSQERKMFEAIHWMSEQHGRGLLEYWKRNDAARGDSTPTARLTPSAMDDLVQ